MSVRLVESGKRRIEFAEQANARPPVRAVDALVSKPMVGNV
jgi:hypothetical protein